MAAACDKTGVHPAIQIFSYKEFKKLDADVALETLRKFQIIVTDCPVEGYEFNRTCLVHLTRMDKPVTIHGKHLNLSRNAYTELEFPLLDHSIKDEVDKAGSRHRCGTLQDMITAARQENGKALNGLDFPQMETGTFPLPFSTDRVCWNQVSGESWCDASYPTEFMRWGLCATAGAFHKIHRDCEGGCTFCGPDCGVKIWMIGVPKAPRPEDRDKNIPKTHRKDSYDYLANVNIFTEDYDSEKPNEHLVDWVAVVLKPGSFL